MGFKRASEAAPSKGAQRQASSPDDALGQLRDPDPEVRVNAALRLAGVVGAVQSLCEALAAEEDRAVREAILQALQATGGRGVVEGMIPLLASEDVHLRNAAIEMLSHSPEVVGPYMHELLGQEDSDVRIFALDVMQNLPHPEIPEWIAGVLEREEHVNVVATALDRLLEVGRPDQVDQVRACAARFADEPFIQYTANLVIQRMEAVGD